MKFVALDKLTDQIVDIESDILTRAEMLAALTAMRF